LDGSVDIATKLGARSPRNRGLIPGGGNKFFCCPKCSDRLWGPTSYLLLKAYRGRGTYSLGVKRPESETDCSSTASEQNEWSCMPRFIPQMALHWDDFTLLLPGVLIILQDLIFLGWWRWKSKSCGILYIGWINLGIQNYSFACCLVWVWNLVAHIEGGT